MQKLVYISNNRDFTEQKDINENRYVRRVNELLEQGWYVTSIDMPNLFEIADAQEPLKEPFHMETIVGFVVLEKPDEPK
ncbi:MAG: hypothetical protein FWD84_06270 [Oscillospiraceae bacterium]|nr:hypothetical protein [Oscillospiraceae bacterium]